LKFIDEHKWVSQSEGSLYLGVRTNDQLRQPVDHYELDALEFGFDVDLVPPARYSELFCGRRCLLGSGQAILAENVRQQLVAAEAVQLASPLGGGVGEVLEKSFYCGWFGKDDIVTSA
jgi:hypothetical protein